MTPFLITPIYSQFNFNVVQELDTRWDEILLSMSKIPSDEVLESLYKLRIREFDRLKTVSELFNMDIHQKISMPKYQRLKQWCKGA